MQVMSMGSSRNLTVRSLMYSFGDLLMGRVNMIPMAGARYIETTAVSLRILMYSRSMVCRRVRWSNW